MNDNQKLVALSPEERAHRHQNSLVIHEALCSLEKGTLTRAEALAVVDEREAISLPEQAEFFSAVRELVNKVADVKFKIREEKTC